MTVSESYASALREIESLKIQLARTESQNDRLIESIEAVANCDWRYSHGEIEAACGGETAQEVRQAVIARRKRIDAVLSTEKSD